MTFNDDLSVCVLLPALSFEIFRVSDVIKTIDIYEACPHLISSI